MAKKIKKGAFMAGSIPHGNKEPAFVSIYRGCSICSYYDKNKALRLVMFNEDGSVRYGTNEALRVNSRALLDGMYNLQLVRTIGEEG